jgi:hypothetical protein
VPAVGVNVSGVVWVADWLQHFVDVHFANRSFVVSKVLQSFGTICHSLTQLAQATNAPAPPVLGLSPDMHARAFPARTRQNERA